ncbi:AraC family transcriptional regulator [Saccharopolyspora oryzae]|uniref:AraC family transcriptional regulator n=1 Tax=Saccharopolyspora oryzae TaxID=2997343 RepID=A0ABT4V1W8_9PSEU|nr:AraC family transcriptional regulator [Saccharopolyspora oryzae]MDA3627952.1 AraC family transcriptional regulator [Saccharopolyspora oryzae]
MDRIGQDRITDVPFRPSPGGPPGVEVWDFDRLVERATGHGLDLHRPLRAEFHHLITVRSGTLRTWLDGPEHELRPGEWLWIRPGQVYRFPHGTGGAEGVVLLFTPGFLDAATLSTAHLDPPYPDRPLVPDQPEDAAALRATLDLLQDAYRRIGALPLDAHITLVRHLLAALVVRLGHLHGREHLRPGTHGNDTFHRFHQAVERDFAAARQVADYAAALGYSPRTLTRACLEVTGRTAKQYLDDRVALEAKRLLVHTALAPAQVADQLGFTSATVFTKFFRRCTGETPTAFRSRARTGK